MLIGHEVGHALYTTEEYIKPIEENHKLMGYMNIIEDVRIEKLIKRKYPGLRKRMNEGYKQLNDRDFFGVKSIQNFDDLLLIDKINLYFKVGFQCGVEFSPEEKDFVNRAERCETVQEVIDLAQEIYAYSKEKAEERKQNAKQQGLDQEDESEELDDMDPIESDFDFDQDDFDQEEEDDNDLKNQNKSPKQNDDKSEDDDLESKTDRVFQNKLDDLADDSTEYNYWKFDTDSFEDPVIDYKRILSETKTPEEMDTDDRYDYQTRYMTDAEKSEHHAQFRKDYDMFKVDTARTVNYLVKEFEMKKSAQMYKRAQTSKIGSLDMRKVYAYKIKDDLFKRVTTIPQGKNHGMIMLVDWSGSMNNVLVDTLKQVINLAQFCARVQIPYRVFAFTTSYDDCRHRRMSAQEYADWSAKRNEHAKTKYNREGKWLDATGNFHLLELFSNKMTTSEFNSMARRVLDYRFQWNDGYATGGTPLNEAMVWVYENLGKFIQANNVEKTTFITLTDGEGGSFNTNRGSRGLDAERTEIVDNKYKRVKQKHYIKDDVTQKTYELTRDSTVQSNVVLKMIKDRYNVSVVGFHICQNHKRDLYSVIHANIPNYQGDTYALIEQWRKSFRQDNFASIKNTGRDELFVIPQSSTKIQEGELEVTGNANAKVIAKNFGKFLNVKKTSRVLLNRFVALVA
jgi:uncharacterized protein with von Willebrand factor type A (vWA) domain